MLWIKEWDKVRQHYIDWWNGEGLVLYIEGLNRKAPHQPVEACEPHSSLEQFYTDPIWMSRYHRYKTAHTEFLADSIPLVPTDEGTLTLSAILGSRMEFASDTVWYWPCIKDEEEFVIEFNEKSSQWQNQKRIIEESKRLAGASYYVGFPPMVPGLDILAALCGTEKMLVDMIERPEWVQRKLDEIDSTFMKYYEQIYNIVKMEDGSSIYRNFFVWSTGRALLQQCDNAAMISPAMFERFVVPSLTRTCQFVDNSLFHLDGTQCLVHLDLLLSVKELGAIEWTPQTGIDGGGSPMWYELYRKILNAGKSVQVVGVKVDEIAPLLENIGSKGVFLLVFAQDEFEAEKAVELVEKYRDK